jgi:amino acid transporter
MSSLKKLNTLALTLLIAGSIDITRNLPASALLGSSLIFFFLFATFFFLIPTMLVSAELSANIDDGGVYEWGRRAFGPRVGFLAVWLQWSSNVVWFPAVLSSVAGTATYLIDPALAQNKLYLVSVILFIFWGLTLINLRGLHLSAKFTSFCSMSGLIIPLVFIIAILIAWLSLDKPLQIHLSLADAMPNWHEMSSWVSLTGIMLGFMGLELATVHIKEVNYPQKTFPRALIISTFIILATMVMGSLVIAFLIPAKDINLVNGTIQAFAFFFNTFHMSWLTPVLTVLLIIGGVGGIVSWIISPAKGLWQASQHRFLPAYFEQVNKHGVAQHLLIAQAIFVTFICIAFLLLPSVNASYWLLTSLCAQLYLLMYVVMFISGIRLRRSISPQNKYFSIPGKQFGTTLTCIMGLIGCLSALAIGFIPPSGMGVGDELHYELVYCGSLLLMLLPAFFMMRYQNTRYQQPNKAVPIFLDDELESETT